MTGRLSNGMDTMPHSFDEWYDKTHVDTFPGNGNGDGNEGSNGRKKWGRKDSRRSKAMPCKLKESVSNNDNGDNGGAKDGEIVGIVLSSASSFFHFVFLRFFLLRRCY